jgi:hypothetical protein
VQHRCRELTCTQSLHEHSISQTDISVRKHVLALSRLVRSLTSRLVVDTNDHQPLVGDRVDKVLTADLDWVDSLRDSREERRYERERANWLPIVS